VNVNDNAAANDNSGGSTDGTADTDDDGLTDDIDPDDDNDGIVDDQDNTPQGEPANDNAGNDNAGGGDDSGGGSGNGSSSGGGGSRGGLCGLGVLGAMPIGLVGMGAMAWRRRRGEDWGLGTEARGGRCPAGEGEAPAEPGCEAIRRFSRSFALPIRLSGSAMRARNVAGRGCCGRKSRSPAAG